MTNPTEIPQSIVPLTITLPIPDSPRLFDLVLVPGTERLLMRVVREGDNVVLQWMRADDFKSVSELIE